MNQDRAKAEREFFDQDPPAIGPATSQWQKLAEDLRDVDENDPLQLPQTRASREIWRRLGQGLLQQLDLGYESKPPAQPQPQPTRKPERPLPEPLLPQETPVSRKQHIRRRIGAAALALSLGVGAAALAGPKLVDFIKREPYGVATRTPTEEEICAIRGTNNQALLVVASEFTDNIDARRGAARRISNAIRDQADDKFGVCYSPSRDYSRVLTDEAVADLPPERLVSWQNFPGRTDRY